MGNRDCFLRSTWNLATQSLPATAWPAFETHHPDFPAQGTSEKKLACLSHILRRELAPRDSRANPNLRYERMSADLNKYHDWLLSRIIRQAYDEYATRNDKTPVRHRTILPEDLPKVIDALALFHKHNADIARSTHIPATGTIQHYKTLDALRDAVLPYYTISNALAPEERERGFKSHLKDLGGDGGASIITTLENGTILLHIHSEAASLAFGSPHWCTSYRNKPTSFDSYRDNLLLLLEPTGARHQIHLSSGQVRNAHDNPVELKSLVAANPGLDSALAAHHEQALSQEEYLHNAYLRALLDTCRDIPALETAIVRSGILTRSLDHAAHSAVVNDLGKIITSCIGTPTWESALTRDYFLNTILIRKIEERSHAAPYFLLATTHSPALTECICHESGLPRALLLIGTQITAPKKTTLSGGYPITRSTCDSLRQIIDMCSAHKPYADIFLSIEYGIPKILSDAKRKGAGGHIQNFLENILRNMCRDKPQGTPPSRLAPTLQRT